MKDYEILSRATAFLVGVDPPPPPTPEGPYGHLEASEQRRKDRRYRRQHPYSAAAGPGRDIMDLSWLEFVPKEVRPQTHIVSSSHVLSPFLWTDYYPQDWLTQVRQEHCTYAVEVFDPAAPQAPLAKLPLNPEPFHHPEGRDIALIHFQEEESSLKILKGLGVEILYLRDPDKLYQKGEDLIFDGFVVDEPDLVNGQQPNKAKEPVDEDTRIFCPHVEPGKLTFHTEDRFFASTPKPLQEGLCGAPVLDTDGDLCGTVEGIVPVDHKNKNLAGSAAFIPSFVMAAFIDYVERGLLEHIMPKDLFQMVVMAKKTNSIGGGVFRPGADGSMEETDWEQAYDMAIANLKKRYSTEEVDAIMNTIQREREEVMEIFEKEGGDMDEIMERVRLKTMQIREMVRDQYQKQKMEEEEQRKA